MDGEFQAFRFGFLEGRLEDGDIADGWVAAEIDADDALRAVLLGERDDGEGGGEVVAAVD